VADLGDPFDAGSGGRSYGGQTMAVTEYLHAQQDLFAAYGLDAEVRLVDVPVISGKVQVLVSGDGPPLVLVIGAGVPAALWVPLMARLDGFRLYAVDLPGQGGSDRAEVTTAGIRSLMTDLLDEVMTGLDLSRAGLVAQSMGGLFSIWLAQRMPKRVSSLSLVGSPAFLPGTFAPVPIRLMATPGLGRLIGLVNRPSPRQVERFGAIAGEEFGSRPELARVMLELARLPQFAADLRRLLRACLTFRRPRPEVALTDEDLAGLTVPVQLVWGDRDPFGPRAAGRRAAEMIPGARYDEVPGGHAPWLDSTDQVAALVRQFAVETERTS
jgi:pimeloyl-ACP methyl ester carboxylesterase